MTALFAIALGLAVVAAARGLWSPCGLSMMSALNPVAEAARGHRWGVTVAWHIAGAVAGGAALGGCCALVAAAFGHLDAAAPVTWSVAASAAAVTLLADRGVAGFTLPVHPRQVDQRWLTAYRRWVYAAGFGAQLGAGFATYIMTSATYLVAVLAALTGNPVRALLVGLVFGAVRGATLLATAGATTPARLRSRLAGLDARSGASMLAAQAAQLTVLTGAAAAAAAALAGAAAGIVAAGAILAVAVAAPTARRRLLARRPAPTLPETAAVQ